MATTTVPTWLKWGLGLVAVGAAVAAAPLLIREFQGKDPWGGEDLAPKLKKKPVAVVYDVLQGDDDDAWYVGSTFYDGVDEHGDEYNGHGGSFLRFEKKKDAVKKARELAEEARNSGDFKSVRVIASKKDWADADKRRRASEDREARAA